MLKSSAQDYQLGQVLNKEDGLTTKSSKDNYQFVTLQESQLGVSHTASAYKETYDMRTIKKCIAAVRSGK